MRKERHQRVAMTTLTCAPVPAKRDTRYPFAAETKAGHKGTVYRVLFLPQACWTPPGERSINGVIRKYSQQLLVCKVPDLEVFIPDSPIYCGPIEIQPAPGALSCIIRLDDYDEETDLDFVDVDEEPKDNKGIDGRKVKTDPSLVGTPAEMTLRFWPPAQEGQLVPQEFIREATSRHAVRGEVNNIREHLIRPAFTPREELTITHAISSSLTLRKKAIMSYVNKTIGYFTSFKRSGTQTPEPAAKRFKRDLKYDETALCNELAEIVIDMPESDPNNEDDKDFKCTNSCNIL